MFDFDNNLVIGHKRLILTILSIALIIETSNFTPETARLRICIAVRNVLILRYVLLNIKVLEKSFPKILAIET